MLVSPGFRPLRPILSLSGWIEERLLRSHRQTLGADGMEAAKAWAHRMMTRG
jgi:hypothetical protein